MQFTILPISENNPDIDFLKLIEKEGIICFVTLSEKIEEGTKEDKRLFKNYLNNYLFGGLNFTQNVWLEFMKCLSLSEKTIQLINYIESESNKETAVKMIIEMYHHEDMDKILLNPSVLPYWNLKESGILDKLLKRKQLHLIKFLKCTKTRNETKEWIHEFYNENKRLKSLSSVNIIDIYHLDKKFEDITYIAMQLLKIFMRGVTFEKLLSFKMPSEENSFLNELFYIVHKYLELSIMNLMGIHKSIRNALEAMNEVYRESQVNGDNLTENMYKMKIDFFSSLLEKLKKIDYDETLCLEFYQEMTIEWISKIENFKSEIMDGILSSTVEFLGNERRVIYFSKNLFRVFMSILDIDNKLTSSDYIKCKTMMIFASHFENLETCAKIYVLNNIDEFVKSLTHLYVNIASLDDYDVIVYQLEILRLLSPYKQIIFDTVTEEFTNKFVNIFLEFFDYFYKGFLKNIKLIHHKKNDTSISEEERNVFIEGKRSALKWYQKEIFTMNEFLTNEQFVNCTMHLGIRDKFATVLGFLLETFMGKHRKELVVGEDKVYFNAIIHLKNIYTILCLLHKNEDFKKAIVAEDRYTKTSYIYKMLDKLHKLHLILTREYEEIQKLCIFIDEERAKQKEEDDDEDIPEDLLDPIMGSLIKTPVALPNSDTIMEKDVIVRHLMNQEENPFTREPLTMKELEEYNARDDIQSLLSNFKQRLLDRR